MSPGASTCRRTSGVRTTVPRILSLAARMSSIVMGSSGGITCPAQRDTLTNAVAHSLGVDVGGRTQILNREAKGFEERDLPIIGAPGRAAEHQLANFPNDVRGCDCALTQRNEKVSRFVQR